MQESIADFVQTPRGRFAITICSAGWVDMHSSQFNTLADAETAARELSRDHRHAVIVIHEHNGAQGWQRGTSVVGRFEQGCRITPAAVGGLVLSAFARRGAPTGP